MFDSSFKPNRIGEGPLEHQRALDLTRQFGFVRFYGVLENISFRNKSILNLIHSISKVTTFSYTKLSKPSPFG